MSCKSLSLQFISLSLCSLTALTAALVVPVSGAHAAADIVRGSGCAGFDANGTPAFDPAAQVQVVFTNNKNGVANARCEGNLQPGQVLPTKALKFNFANTGFFCLGGDETWQEVVTPSGNFSLICHLK